MPRFFEQPVRSAAALFYPLDSRGPSNLKQPV
jgi:hypothetical protein